MNSSFKNVLIAGVLATAGFAGVAQRMDHGGGMGHGPRDPAKMQEMIAKHQADLKAKLKITPAQEGAWGSFTTAMKPPAGMMGQRPDRAEMGKLTTPERIDKMKAMRTQRDAEMDKRSDATKAFYAALSPEQKTVFDTESMHRGGRHGR